MKRLVLIALVASVLVAIPAAGASAQGAKPMEAHGTETFELNLTCNPGSAFGGVDPAGCRTAGPNVFLGLANPGSRTGTFNGVQFFDGKVNTKANGDFTFRGVMS